jgi:hypothetical protein
VISKEDFIDWKNHPVTKEFMQRLEVDVQNFQDDWSDGINISDPIQNARMIGKVQAINLIREIDFDSLFGGSSNE